MISNHNFTKFPSKLYRMQPKRLVKFLHERGENMKFGDKLIALRKKNGLSQEELAEKLNVSRQSVSKWESNNTYPETDKIVQICNLFNCSMDDLINDKITDIENVSRTEKNNLNIGIDSLLDFVTRTINMFSNMTFWSGFKCLIELAVIAGVLAVSGIMITGIFSMMISELFAFTNYSDFIRNIIDSLTTILWFILSIIILVHVFKIRYLDYYDKAIVDPQKEEKKQSKVEEAAKEKKQPAIKEKENRIIIRDAKDQPFAFLSILSKIITWFIKLCVLMLNLGAIVTLFCLVVAFVVLIPLCLKSSVFLGINLTVLAGIAITLLVIVILFKFILNKKNNFKLAIIILLSSTVFGAIGSGIGIIGLKNIEFKETEESTNTTLFEEKIYYTDNLFIDHGHHNYDIEYVVDNSMAENEIVINTNYNKDYFKVESDYQEEDKMSGYYLWAENNLNFKKFYNDFIENLKNNVIITSPSTMLHNIEIHANESTVNKLLANYSKIYLYEKINTPNGFKITSSEYKVVIESDGCGYHSYNALTDTMNIDSKTCKCERRTIETYKGTKVIYNCENLYDADDNYNYEYEYE